MQQQQLRDKVALVTGAGSGIGRACALLFAREGAKIGVLSHAQEEVDRTVADIARAGGEAVGLVADVSNVEQMQAAVERLVTRFGRIDVTVANAGINGVWAPIEELEPDEWDRTIDTNLKGTFLTIKYAVPHMKRAGGGSIIVVSSVNGTRIFSNTGATAYGASKAGQLAIAKMLALEFAREHVRVNVICPGAIETNIGASTEQRDLDKVKIDVEFETAIPLTDKPGRAEQVAQLALFLASDASSHITGTPVWIDGAQSLLQG